MTRRLYVIDIGRALQPAFATVTLERSDGEFTFTGTTADAADEARWLVESICKCFPYRIMSKREQLQQLPVALDNGYLWAAARADRRHADRRARSTGPARPDREEG